jgi:hypothetical protein
MGDRVHLAGPAVDLDTHITDVANVLEFEDRTDVRGCPEFRGTSVAVR